MNRRTFNLVIAGSVAVILFLALGFLADWRIRKNDQLAVKRAAILYKAIESYVTKTKGDFPKKRADLNLENDVPFCNETKDGFNYTCTFTPNKYGIEVYPLIKGKTGTAVIHNSTSQTMVYSGEYSTKINTGYGQRKIIPPPRKEDKAASLSLATFIIIVFALTFFGALSKSNLLRSILLSGWAIKLCLLNAFLLSEWGLRSWAPSASDYQSSFLFWMLWTGYLYFGVYIFCAAGIIVALFEILLGQIWAGVIGLFLQIFFAFYLFTNLSGIMSSYGY